MFIVIIPINTAIITSRLYAYRKRKNSIIRQGFNDKKMIRTFPNLKIEDQDGEIIYFQDLVGDIQPYYYKLNEHLRGDLKNTLIKQEERYENVIQTIENKL